VLDLRVTGWAFGGTAVSDVVKRVGPWSLLGAILTVVSGMALYSADPERMAAVLTRHAGLSLPDAAMLLSLAGDVRVCQVVNALKTCRMEVEHTVLRQLGLDLPSLLRSCEVRASSTP